MPERYECMGQIVENGVSIDVRVQAHFFSGGCSGGWVVMKANVDHALTTRWDITGGDITRSSGPYGQENPLQFIDFSKSVEGVAVANHIRRMRDSSRESRFW